MNIFMKIVNVVLAKKDETKTIVKKYPNKLFQTLRSKFKFSKTNNNNFKASMGLENDEIKTLAKARAAFIKHARFCSVIFIFTWILKKNNYLKRNLQQYSREFCASIFDVFYYDLKLFYVAFRLRLQIKEHAKFIIQLTRKIFPYIKRQRSLIFFL